MAVFKKAPKKAKKAQKQTKKTAESVGMARRKRSRAAADLKARKPKS
jgi:hypothetical protein